MSQGVSAAELLAFSNRANLGTYLDSFEEIAPSLFYVYSKNIPDAYCNFGYRLDLDPLTKSQLNLLEKIAASKSRVPAIWQTSQTIPTNYSLANREVAMVAETNTLSPYDIPKGVTAKTRSPLPAAEMVRVFGDVFCAADNVGYPAFAKGYVAIYGKALPKKYTDTSHIGIYVDGVCVGISTVIVIDKMAGLYSVAILPEHRRKGFGKLVTQEGVRLASQKGAEKIMLFTSPNSFMQAMYESVGFKPVFVAEILTKQV